MTTSAARLRVWIQVSRLLLIVLQRVGQVKGFAPLTLLRWRARRTSTSDAHPREALLMADDQQTAEQATADWYASLPRTRMAAAALFFDDTGALLIVEPTYRSDGWGLPGGLIEANESPRDASRREVHEELALDRPLGRLRCVDWCRAAEPQDAVVVYLFDGGTLSPDEVAAMRLPPDELKAHAFAAPGDDLTRLQLRQRRRVVATLAADPLMTLYLEDGQLPP